MACGNPLSTCPDAKLPKYRADRKGCLSCGGASIARTLKIDGPRPVLHRVTGTIDAIRVAASLIESACGRHKTPPNEVAVLTLATLDDSSPWRIDRLGSQRTAETPRADCVTVATVRRFKGLEAARSLSSMLTLAAQRRTNGDACFMWRVRGRDMPYTSLPLPRSQLSGQQSKPLSEVKR